MDRPRVSEVAGERLVEGGQGGRALRFRLQVLVFEIEHGALSDEHREVITLARVVQLPHAVIAESMGRTEAAVRQLLVRALLELSRQLKRRGVSLE